MSNRAHITVIDDDQPLRLSLMSLLRSLGHETEGYSSADAFLDSADLDRSDCIVTDVQMPGTDGIALKKKLDRLGSSTPVILITALGEADLRDLGDGGAPFSIMRKPLEMKLFNDLLARALNAQPLPPSARN